MSYRPGFGKPGHCEVRRAWAGHATDLPNSSGPTHEGQGRDNQQKG